MLLVTVQHLSFTNLLKRSYNQSVNASGLQILQCYACSFDILSGIGHFNSLVTPAYPGMTLQVTGGPGITCIQEPTNEACPATTLRCRTFEYMGLLVVDILNRQYGFEEHIDGGIPVLSESS
jgi:hypothetical protein